MFPVYFAQTRLRQIYIKTKDKYDSPVIRLYYIWQAQTQKKYANYKNMRKNAAKENVTPKGRLLGFFSRALKFIGKS